MPTITISFRAKLDDYAGGRGYRMPKLTDKHVTMSDPHDMLSREFLSTLNDERLTESRLKSWAGLAGYRRVIFGEGTGVQTQAVPPVPWTITPRGNGFMADLTITLPISRHRAV
jgi:hypothetical protein